MNPIFNAQKELADYNRRRVDIGESNTFQMGEHATPVNAVMQPSIAAKIGDNLLQVPGLVDEQIHKGYDTMASATGVPAISYVPDVVGMIGEGAAIRGANKVREAVKAVPSFLDRVTQGYNNFRSQ